MSTTTTGPRLSHRAIVNGSRFVGNDRQRRPFMAIGSLALVTVCIATFTSVYLNAGNRVAVLALAHDVPQGHAIRSGDLTVVNIAYSHGIAPVAAVRANQVVGRKAAVPLIRGTLLSPTELLAHRPPVRGTAVVGVAAKLGQLPAEGVVVGDKVDVILTGSPATLSGGATGDPASSSPPAAGQVEVGGVLASNATVTDVAGPSSSSPDTIVVSVEIPTEMAPLVASASSAGQAALVLVGSNS
jgi:hypothetical protein